MMKKFAAESTKEPEWNGHGDGSTGIDSSSIMSESVDSSNGRRQSRNVRRMAGSTQSQSAGLMAGRLSGGKGTGFWRNGSRGKRRNRAARRKARLARKNGTAKRKRWHSSRFEEVGSDL